MTRCSKRQKQAELPFSSRGGARKGAGRKPKGAVAGVSHGKREAFPARHPAHVSMKIVRGMPSLRSRRLFRAVRGAIAAHAHPHPEKLGMRVCEFSVQSNHLHLIVEAGGKESLSRGMQGLAIRLARSIQRALTRPGRVFADRYFARILKTPLEVKRALAYVLNNARKHGSILSGIDPCSSGPWFDGWRGGGWPSLQDQKSVALARSWLLRSGWRRHGLISAPGAPFPGTS